MSDYQALKTELTTDPQARGYAGMSDAQAAASLVANYRQEERTHITNAELYEAIVDSEFTALAAAAQTRVRDLFNLNQIPVQTGTRARSVLLAVFGAGTTTRTNLVNVVRIDVRRCDDIGWRQGVTEQDVTVARTL